MARDELGLVKTAHESDIIEKYSCTNGVYMVPAFTGKGHPTDMYARGTIVGITSGTNETIL